MSKKNTNSNEKSSCVLDVSKMRDLTPEEEEICLSALYDISDNTEVKLFDS